MIGRPRGTKTTKQCSNARCKKYLSTNNKTITCYTCKLKADKKRMKQLKQKKYEKVKK